jgi:hypothetical protein
VPPLFATLFESVQLNRSQSSESFFRPPDGFHPAYWYHEVFP